MSEVNEKVDSSLEERLYCLYDMQLHEYEKPFVCRRSELDSICDLLVNSCESKYWNTYMNYQVVDMCKFDKDKGIIEPELSSYSLICRLDSYLDVNKRRIQVCIQTLNYLPVGYYKMTKEEQKPIQDRIDKAINEYCEMFVKDNPTVVNN